MFILHLLVAALMAQTADHPAPRAVRDTELERENLAQLVAIRRVFVDRLNGGETAAQLRDMIISSLERSKLFAITENAERADAVLRGSAEDLVFTENFSASDGINAHGSLGANNGVSTSSKNRKSGYANAGVSEQESIHTSERKHEAAASVRLVNKDGDVIWSTTQESMGAKFRGAGADVADKITKQLLADYDRGKRTGGK
jgi:hypothetical protein